MNKMRLVFAQEFKQNVLKPSFLIVLLIFPLILALIIGMGLIIESTLQNDLPLGYVDLSGLIDPERGLPQEIAEESVAFIPFEDEESALQALDSSQIQAYYMIPAGYVGGDDPGLVYYKSPGEGASRDFARFMRYQLLADLPAEAAKRLTIGSSVTVHSLDDERTYPEGNPTMGMLIPLLLSVAFIGLLITGGGYIIQAIFKERQNRTIEILSTSLSPSQIVWGKILGATSVNLIQISFWILIGILAVAIAGSWLDYAWFQNVEMEWGTTFKFLLIAIPSYIFVVALTFSFSLLVGSQQDSERIGPFLMLAFILPIYTFTIIGKDPNGTLSIVLTLLPFTSLLTFGLRSLMSIVPTWQVAASSLIQTGAALVSVWVAVRLFRTGWLRSGFRISEKRSKNSAMSSRSQSNQDKSMEAES